jgi:hypothetical protein
MACIKVSEKAKLDKMEKGKQFKETIQHEVSHYVIGKDKGFKNDNLCGPAGSHSCYGL